MEHSFVAWLALYVIHSSSVYPTDCMFRTLFSYPRSFFFLLFSPLFFTTCFAGLVFVCFGRIFLCRCRFLALCSLFVWMFRSLQYIFPPFVAPCRRRCRRRQLSLGFFPSSSVQYFFSFKALGSIPSWFFSVQIFLWAGLGLCLSSFLSDVLKWVLLLIVCHTGGL